MKQTMLILVGIVFMQLYVCANENRVISGTVLDDTGNPIPGVSIMIENTRRGTTSDYNGFYKIETEPGDKRLVFSFVGMKTKKLKITESNTINVTMKQEQLALEETIVMGFGRHKKSLSIGGYVPRAEMTSMACVAYDNTNWNTENYASIRENGFKNARVNPLSTFSIDVDNASYSNVRRYLNQGNLPPKDAVRIEEMINYFNYDYAEPTGKHPFSVNTELARCPWNAENYLLHIGLKGKQIDKTELPASNLVFLLDVSGSMHSANKLPLLKRAFSLLVNEMRPEDRVAIVVYAGAAGVVLESTSGENKTAIMQAIEKLQAGGSTAGGEGLRLAYKVAHDNYIDDGNNRIVLATDGDFNVGVSSTSEMERLVEKEKENGVFMTVLGFGTGNIKDDKMETIADKGNGNYSYIDNIQEARKVLITEFGGTLYTIAKDVKFQLEFNPENVKAYRLVGYENRLLNDEDFNDDTKDAGEMGAGHTVTALYEIIPANAEGQEPDVDALKYQKTKPVKGSVSDELLTLKIRYKQPDESVSTKLDLAVNKQLKTETSDSFRFSAAVATFGMYLRDSEYINNISIDDIVDLAQKSKGEDDDGYRAEFIRLVKTTGDLNLAQTMD
jgi:Ca-activated chloride channel family protein